VTENYIDRHHGAYLDAMALQHEQALALLTQKPPDFSMAATACHRALQFQRQAEALMQLRRDVMSGE
jgi:hypothetical protein